MALGCKKYYLLRCRSDFSKLCAYLHSHPEASPRLLRGLSTLLLCATTSQTLRRYGYTFAVLTFLFCLLPTSGFTGQLFPLYPEIKNNVRFWEKIYSIYSLNDAVIHDSDDLSRIYEIVHLLDSELPASKRINRETQQRTRDNYSKILKKIAHSKKAATAEERRIAAFFKGSQRFKDMAKAADNVRSQTGQKERFLEGVIRSKSYMKKMKEIFRSYKLPQDLAYIPHVESSFNTKAYSKFGAAGIWQFTRETGKQYLKINYSLDERLDPISATRAAAQYLKNSYRLLDNWPLAITSYNYGTSGTLRAVKAKGSYENIFSGYDKGHFKFASKNFYPEFLAALKVAKQLENRRKIKQQHIPSVRYLKLHGYIHIDRIESHFRLSRTEIKELNPALRNPVFAGEKLIPKGYSLRLPNSEKINRSSNSIPSSFYADTQKLSIFHKVKKGETVGSIAKQHGISNKSLSKANNLDQYATIYVRQKLRLPALSIPSSPGQEVSKIKRENIKFIQKQLRDGSLPLLAANKKNKPSTKQDIYIPQRDPDAYSVFKIFKKDKKIYGYITVQPEESLGLYAQWLGSTTDKIRKINNSKLLTEIEPGKKVLLAFEKHPAAQFEEKRLDYLREIEEDFFTAYAVVGQKPYKVNNGDTFWDLCYNRFDIPMWLLERYNSSLNLSKLKSSQELMIPILKAI